MGWMDIQGSIDGQTKRQRENRGDKIGDRLLLSSLPSVLSSSTSTVHYIEVQYHLTHPSMRLMVQGSHPSYFKLE
jgi:hypothetical protein